MGNIVTQNLFPTKNEPVPLDNSELSEKIAQAIQKKHLRVGTMGLTSIPNALISPQNSQHLNATLKSLDLHGNQLTHFPCIELPCLTELNLWGNNLKDEMFAPYEPSIPSLPDPQRRTKPRRLKRGGGGGGGRKNEASGVFSKVPSLEILDLGNNHLTKLPASLKECVRLSQLHLSGNFLTSSDPSALAPLEGLSNLSFLDMDLNQLDRIPECIYTDKPKIYTLLLRGNCITEIPSAVGQLTALQKLHLGDNSIQSIHPGALEPLTKMKTLILFNNQISTLPEECFLQYRALTSLDLSRNALLWLPSLSGLESLRHLNVSRNQLEALPDLSRLVALTDLNVSFNLLGELPHTIGKLSQLRVLNCCSNQLRFLPATMVRLDRLDSLNLQSNRFSQGGLVLRDDFDPEQFEKDAFFKNNLDDRIEFGLSPVWSLKALQTLHLALNELTKLPPDAFSQLLNIRTINLAGNLLTQHTLPIFTSKKLSSTSTKEPLPMKSSSLIIENDQDDDDDNDNDESKDESSETGGGIVQFQESPGSSDDQNGDQLPQLQVGTLLLNSNNISEFPLENLRPLHASLSILTLDGNPIKQIPPEIAIFSKLTRLTISAPVFEGPSSLSNDSEPDQSSLKSPPPKSSLRNSSKSPKSPKSSKSSSKRKSSTDEENLVLFPEEIGSLHNLERIYVGNHFRQQSTRIGLNLDQEEKILSKIKCTDLRDHEAFPGSCSVEMMGQLDSRITGWSICTGNAPHPVEDCISMHTYHIGEWNVDFVGVFDGHGGSEVSLWIQKSLGEILRKFLPSDLNGFSSHEEMNIVICRSICDAFDEANHQLREYLERLDNREDGAVGSTAVIVLILENVLFCANVGDSRAVLATKSKSSGMSVTDMQDQMDQLTIQLHRIPKQQKDNNGSDIPPSSKERRGSLRAVRISVDHKPGLRKEVERIRKANLFVMPDVAGGSSYRMGYAIGPAIAVSRAFGDFFLNAGVSAKPHIHCHTIKASDQFIVMGSDGIWDVLSDEEVSRFVFHLLKHLHLVQGYDLTVCCNIAASRVRDLAFSLGSNDDISVVVVLLNFGSDKHRKRALFSAS